MEKTHRAGMEVRVCVEHPCPLQAWQLLSMCSPTHKLSKLYNSGNFMMVSLSMIN